MNLKVKRRLNLVLYVLMILLAASGCSSKIGSKKTTSEVSNYTDTIQEFIDSVDEDYAYSIAYELAYNEDYGGELGFRTAGSKYEHKAADYLVGLMEEIGLEEIEKVGVDVDAWQFDYASLTVDGTDISITPAAYAQNGTNDSGITTEIVNVGTGVLSDYQGLDVKGKIVLAGIDQWNEAWIDGYITEAYLQGAAALVTYDVGGYASYSDEIRNIQDVCCSDLIPAVSISAKESALIAEQIASGSNRVTLTVKNSVTVGEGTSYNVIGRIKGKSSKQQLILSGHYDKYFYGFQDNSCSIGLLLSVAKAMKASDYVPENDIVFVCHGAEEWGASGTQFDWATGSWRLINEVHPDWVGKTLALINFELPGFANGETSAFINSVPEFCSLIKRFVEDTGFTDRTDTSVYVDGISSDAGYVNTMEDGISYRFAGIPYFLNGISYEKGFATEKYHTEADDSSTYEEAAMLLHIQLYGSLAIYLDQTPALTINLEEMADRLFDSYDYDKAEMAGADSDAFDEAMKAFRQVAQAKYAEAQDINSRYEITLAEGNTKEMAKLRLQGQELNALVLKAYAVATDYFEGVISSSDVCVRHEGALDTINKLEKIIAAMENGIIWADDGESGALDIAWQLNGGMQYNCYIFSAETTNMVDRLFFVEGNTFWGTDKIIPFADVTEATIALLYEEDVNRARKIYTEQYKEFMSILKGYIELETKGLNAITTLCSSRENTSYVSFEESQSNVEEQEQSTLQNSDFIGKKFAVITGTMLDAAVNDNLGNNELMYFNTMHDATEAVKNKKVDAMIGDVPTMRKFIAKNPELIMILPPLTKDEYGIVVNKINPELTAKLNEFYDIIKADGTYDDMIARWIDSKDIPDMPDIPLTADKGMLKMAVDAVCEPFVFYNGNREIVGFEIEYARRFAQFMDMDLKVVNMDFGAIIPSVQSGKTDFGATLITITQERAKSIDFTKPYYIGGTAIITLGTTTALKVNFIDSFKNSFYQNFILEDRYTMLLSGLWITIVISILALILGTILGFFICFLSMSKYKTLNWISKIYIAILRGTPMVVLLMITYYIIFAKVNINPIIVAIIAFSLSGGAFISQIIRSSILTVDKGQIEAARSMGFSSTNTFFVVTLPQAIRVALPLYKSEFINIMKQTAIVGYIAIVDLTKVGDIIRSRTYDAFFPLIAVAVIYLITIGLFILIFNTTYKLTDKRQRRTM